MDSNSVDSPDYKGPGFGIAVRQDYLVGSWGCEGPVEEEQGQCESEA